MSKKNDLIAIILLFAFTLLYFGNFILTGKGSVLSSARGDLAHSGFYYSELGFSLMKNGKPPLWNPYVFCGVPLLGGLQSAFYYPLKWLSFFIEEGSAINITFILHFFLGSLFMYILLRYYKLTPFSSGIAGMIFSFGAIPVLHLYAGHDCDIWTMAWLPLVILFLDLTINQNKIIYPLAGGVVLGIQILACHPQHVYYTIIGGAIYILFHIKKRTKDSYHFLFIKFFIFLMVAIGLSAIQLLPSLEMVKNSSRLATTSLSWIGQNSLPLENFFTILFPGFLGDIIRSPYMGRWYLWENCLYLGTGTIILGTIIFLFPRNRNIYFAFALVIFGLSMATGKYNPLFRYMARFFPGYSLFRGHAKFIYLYGFGLSILAGYGIEYLFSRLSNRRLVRFTLVWAVAGLVLGAGAMSLFPPGNISLLWEKILASGFKEGERYGISPSDFTALDYMSAYNTMQDSIYAALFFMGLTLLGIYIAAKSRRPLHLRFARVVITLSITADLFMFGQKYLVSFNLKNILQEEPPVTFLKKDKSLFRTGEIISLPLNRSICHRFYSVGGYAGNILSRYNLFINLAQGLALDSVEFALFLRSHSVLMNGLNLKYVLSPTFKRVDHPDFSLAYEDGVISIYENKNVLPRAYLVSETITKASEEDVLKELISPDFDFLKCAVVENETPLERKTFVRRGSVIITHYQANEVELNVNNETESFLVLADMYYPGWNAYIDGKKNKVLAVDYIFRGVEVPAGSHNVIFRYEPLSYRLGVSITILTLLFLSFTSIRALSRRRRGFELHSPYEDRNMDRNF